METWLFTLDIVLLLGACLLSGGLFSRMGQSPIVGYLLAGVILSGAVGAELIQFQDGLGTVAELGVALLLFSLGLEFSWSRIKKFGFSAILIGILQIIITLFAGTAIAYIFRLSFTESLAIGAMVSLSSTACVLRVLSDRREIDSIHGKNSISVLLMQDIAVVPLAILMTLLSGGKGEDTNALYDVMETLFTAALLILSLYLILNKLAVIVLGKLTLQRNRELTVLLAVVAAVGSTWAAHEVGLSPALGAFVAGMFLGGSQFATQIRADISSLQVIFLTLFFGTAGMIADPIWIINNIPLILLTTFLLLISKTIIIWIIMFLMGHSHASAISTGITLSQVGEFAFVLGAIGKSGGVLSDDIYLLIVSSAILALFLTPYAIALAPHIGLAVEKAINKNFTPKTNNNERVSSPPEIILIGFGPTGKKIGAALAEFKKNVMVLDLNKRLVDDAIKIGLKGEVGDALQIDVLEHIKIQFAQIVIITTPTRYSTVTILKHINRLAPNAITFVRARYEIDYSDFKSAGAHIVVGDEEEVGNKLRDKVITLLDT
jgi:monovalent cation:H+ antiporter-2, CPA2 family